MSSWTNIRTVRTLTSWKGCYTKIAGGIILVWGQEGKLPEGSDVYAKAKGDFPNALIFLDAEQHHSHVSTFLSLSLNQWPCSYGHPIDPAMPSVRAALSVWDPGRSVHLSSAGKAPGASFPSSAFLGFHIFPLLQTDPTNSFENVELILETRLLYSREGRTGL